MIKNPNLYTSIHLNVSPDSTNDSYNNTNLHVPKNKRRKKRRNSLKIRRHTKERETKEKFLHNLSSHQFADTQISLLSKGPQFTPTPSAKETRIKQQLLRDFDNSQGGRDYYTFFTDANFVHVLDCFFILHFPHFTYFAPFLHLSHILFHIHLLLYIPDDAVDRSTKAWIFNFLNSS